MIYALKTRYIRYIIDFESLKPLLFGYKAATASYTVDN